MPENIPLPLERMNWTEYAVPIPHEKLKGTEYKVPLPYAEMEFVTNFTRTYFSRKSITTKYSVSYNFLGHEKNQHLPPMLP